MGVWVVDRWVLQRGGVIVPPAGSTCGLLSAGRMAGLTAACRKVCMGGWTVQCGVLAGSNFVAAACRGVSFGRRTGNGHMRAVDRLLPLQVGWEFKTSLRCTSGSAGCN